MMAAFLRSSTRLAIWFTSNFADICLLYSASYSLMKRVIRLMTADFRSAGSATLTA